MRLAQFHAGPRGEILRNCYGRRSSRWKANPIALLSLSPFPSPRRFYMQSASDDYTERLKFCDYFRGFAEGGNYAKNPLCRNINCALQLAFVCNNLNFKLSCLSQNCIKISISQKAFNTLSFFAYMFLIATKFVSCLYELFVF